MINKTITADQCIGKRFQVNGLGDMYTITDVNGDDVTITWYDAGKLGSSSCSIVSANRYLANGSWVITVSTPTDKTLSKRKLFDFVVSTYKMGVSNGRNNTEHTTEHLRTLFNQYINEQ